MTRHMQIALVTETYPPEVNGVANTLRHLVMGLGARGHRVHLIRPRQGADGDRHGPSGAPETLVPSLPIPGYPGLRVGLPIYWSLRRQWRTGRPDLVYIATQGPLGRAALRAARASGIPALTGFHTQFQQYSRHYGLGLLETPIANSLRRFHNRSEATLVPTAELCETLTAQGYANVRVFGRGVDTTRFSPRQRGGDLRRAWGCGPDAPALLYVGRLAAEKNIELIIETFDRVHGAVPGARGILVGDGPELSRLRRTFPRYCFTGAKVGVELAQHFASADLFIFPSLTETYGNVVPEAMASGLGVLAFDTAAAHRLIRCGENGITVAPGDREAFIAAALGAARDLAQVRAYGAQARKTAMALGWDPVIDAFEQGLREVLHRHRGQGASGRLAAPT